MEPLQLQHIMPLLPLMVHPLLHMQPLHLHIQPPHLHMQLLPHHMLNQAMKNLVQAMGNLHMQQMMGVEST